MGVGGVWWSIENLEWESAGKVWGYEKVWEEVWKSVRGECEEVWKIKCVGVWKSV